MPKPIMRAQDVMHRKILSVDGMTTVKEAAVKMRSNQVTDLLVAKRHDEDAWGIVTIMDLIKRVILPDRDAEQVFVYEIMTKPVITVPAGMDIRYVIRLMQRVGVRRAPVEDQGEIVGMITCDSLVLNHDIL
jgi:signal-transduction protein with cAMP-binding, CBS, and nucleotidyltransferase domain